MSDLDTSKLRQAFLDAARLDAEEAMKKDSKPVRIDQEYITSMYITKSIKKNRRNKRVLTILVAVLVVVALTGCAAFYQTIKGFIVTVLHGHDRIEQSSASVVYPAEIADFSILNMCIDNYSITQKQQSAYQIRVEYENSNRDTIVVTQKTIDKSSRMTDNEQTVREILEIHGYQIVCHKYSENFYSYTWNTEYNYVIESTLALSYDILSQIIAQLK